MREEHGENVNLLRSFVQGVGYPGGLILALCGIGSLVGLFNHGTDLDMIWKYTQGGAYLGLFIIFVGGLEIALGVFWEGGPWQNRFARFAGMALVWLGLVLGVLYF